MPRQEGETVAMKFVRKHQLMLAKELKRLDVERLVTERYFKFEHSLIQTRLKKLVTRQKELGIYRSMSPLKKSTNTPHTKNKKAKQTFFITTGTFPPVNKGKQIITQHSPAYYKHKNSKELVILQERIKQFYNNKQSPSCELNKFAPPQSCGLQQSSDEDKKITSKGFLGNNNKLFDSFNYVKYKGTSNKVPEAQESTREQASRGSQDTFADITTTRQTHRLPAINHSSTMVTSEKSNFKTLRKTLNKSNIYQIPSEMKSFEKPKVIHSSIEKSFQLENSAPGDTRTRKTSKSQPSKQHAHYFEELNSAVSKLDIKSDQILEVGKSNNCNDVFPVENLAKLTVNLNARPQSAH